jgi:hypothetical protein
MSDAPKRPAETRDDVERAPDEPSGENDVESAGGEEADQAGAVSPELGADR